MSTYNLHFSLRNEKTYLQFRILMIIWDNYFALFVPKHRLWVTLKIECRGDRDKVSDKTTIPKNIP